MSDINLRDHFLISMPHLSDGHFSQTLTYICDHSGQGAMGLVINRPMEMSLKEVLTHLEMEVKALKQPDMPVYAGGPVQEERGFVLHRPCPQSWISTYEIHQHLHLTTSMDILEAIAAGRGPDQYLIALGYAGWEAGQLEQEMSDNTWLSCPADPDIIFTTVASERLEAAASKLGVNLDLLTSQSGHA